MQEKLKIGDTISFIMNGQPVTPGQNTPPPKVEPAVESVKEEAPTEETIKE